MINSRWYRHPLFIFAFILLAIGSSLFIYISMFFRINEAFASFVNQKSVETFMFLDSTAWATILVLALLLGIVIWSVGLVCIYYKKVVQLYYLQQNFINGFTHELKTPVTSLKLFLETLSLHELSREEQLRCLDFMKKDTNRLSDNISQILDLGKIEDKKYPLDLSKIYLTDFIKGVVKSNSHIFNGVDIQITGDKEVVVFGDYMLFESLIMNVLSNAVIYNDKDAVEIKIHIEDQGKDVEVSFSDNGVGLHGADKKKIFKKFYRVKKVVKGSGIGLYMAQQIAKLHQGSLKAESLGHGKGSVFYMKVRKGEYAT